jgi:hypothetical protein
MGLKQVLPYEKRVNKVARAVVAAQSRGAKVPVDEQRVLNLITKTIGA